MSSLRVSLASSVLVISLFALPARAAVGAWCDSNSTIATVDGTIGSGEYPGFSVGAGMGFGSMIGANVEMYADSDASGNLAFAIDATGQTCVWMANDTVVIYIDSLPGIGFNDTSTMTDNVDGGRAAASGMGTDGSRATLTFAPDFGADFAIVLRGDSQTLFALNEGGSHTFVRTLSRAPSTGFDTACVREVGGFTMDDLGSQSANPFRWVATLINSSNAFRSNELNGTATAPASNIGAASFTLAPGSRNTFESAGLPVGLSGPGSWVDFGTFGGTGFSPTPTCGQLSSNNWSVRLNSTTAMPFGGTETTSGTDYARGPSAGGVTTGGVYAFTVAPNNVALGVQPATGTFVTNGNFTLRLVNNDTTVMTSAQIGFVVYWRNDVGTRSTTVTFSWSTDGNSFTPVPAATVTTPLAADPTPVPWTPNLRTTTVSGLSVPPGSFYYLRFTISDVAGGSGGRDEIAFDDIVVLPTFNTCGDGALDGGEACDLGALNGQCCTWACTLQPLGSTCGDATDNGCDNPDTCDAVGTCVKNHEPPDTVCGIGAGDCDLDDECNGTGTCVDNVVSAGTECRAANAGPCDAVESCDGTNHDCPADGMRGAGSVCLPRDVAQPCDVDDVCNGSTPDCPSRFATMGTCRASTDRCDLGASCDGSGGSCPASVPAPPGTVCRDSVGTCDIEEQCTGTLTCPNDDVLGSGTPCRASTGTCDLGATCGGSSGVCPASVPATMGTPCRPSVGDCDIAEACTGGDIACPSDAVLGAGTTCRVSAGSCDAAELCDGSTGSCPADLPAGDGTPCSDGAPCNGAETCMGGTCTPGSAPTCDDSNLCTSDSCEDAQGGCVNAPIGGCCNVAGDCGDGDVCTTDVCSGAGGTCSHSPITNCCEGDADCTDGTACTTDTCDLTRNRCTFTPIPNCCAVLADCTDTNVCTDEACVSGTCSFTNIAGCCQGDGDCDDSDACTADACETDNTCSHTPTAGCCDADADCTDSDPCTTARCDLTSNQCAFDPLDCSDTDPCTTDSCVSGACQHQPICADAGVADGGAPDAGGGMMDGGCGCRAAPSPATPAWLLLAALAFFVRRRRRSR